MATYNNYSEKLLSHFPKKENIKFQLTGIHVDKVTNKAVIPKSHTVHPTDRIYDPWHKWIGPEKPTKEEKDDLNNYEGDYIQIAYIVSERPAPHDSNRESVIELGDVKFTRELLGSIEHRAGNRATEEMAKFLFFSNQNWSNIGKPWFVAPKGGTFYKYMQPNEVAKNKISALKTVDQATEAVMRFSDAELETYRRGLYPSNWQEKTLDDVRLKLREIAQSDPQKILNLDKSLDVRINADITRYEEAGLIEYQIHNKTWVWGKDKEKIVTNRPGETKFVTLKKFFQKPEGIKTLELLEKMIKETAPAE